MNAYKPSQNPIREKIEKEGYSPTGNMRCKLHVIKSFVFSGDAFGDPRLSLFVDLYVSVCVCVCVFSSHSFWTSSSLDVPAGVTQEEGHTGFLIHLLPAVRALIFLARRIQPFLSLVDREVDFFTNDLIVLHPLGIFLKKFF